VFDPEANRSNSNNNRSKRGGGHGNNENRSQSPQRSGSNRKDSHKKSLVIQSKKQGSELLVIKKRK